MAGSVLVGGGQPLTVTLSQSGSAASLYYDQSLSTSMGTSITIHADTIFWVPEGIYTASVKTAAGVELEGGSITVQSLGRVVLNEQQVAISTLGVLGKGGEIADLLAAYAPALWSQASAFGASFRPATDLLMSTYDANPAATDHTAAFQAAVNAAGAILAAGQASEVQIFLDTRQTYTWSGAVTTGTHAERAQVVLPWTETWSGTIRFVGMPAGDASYIGFGGGSHTVIECGLGSAPAFTAAGGVASMIGGPSSYSTSARSMSLLRFATDSVTFKAATPFICGIDAGWLAGFFASRHLGFTTDHWDALTFPFTIVGAPVCSNQQAIPLITPLVNNYYGSIVEECSVSGWYSGPLIGEAAHFGELRVFATNLCLPLDVAFEESHIEQLWDWDNGNGAGTCGPANTPTSPTTTGLASNVTAGLAAPLHIDSWHIQRAAAAGPAGLLRTTDTLDANAVMRIDAGVRQNQGGAGGTVIVGGLVLGGVGSTGTVNTRILDTYRAPGQHAPAVPASGTTIRNSIFRDAVVVVTGGTVSAVTINGSPVTLGQPALLPANGTITLTYTVAPTWTWWCT